jgi:WD40 repeat protein/serine/threonine protein kinase
MASDPLPPQGSAELAELVGWVDDVADRFEREWQGGTPPRIGSFLADATGARRLTLLRELIRLDIAYRSKLGEERRIEDYLADFPELTEVVSLHAGEARCAGPTPVAAGEDWSTLRPERSAGSAGGTDFPTISGYEILEELGRGGMGVVYKARQVRLNRLVALKMIRSGACAEPQERTRFRMEAEAAARLQHPNIVSIYEVGEQDGRPYCAMEYVDGGSLAQLLRGAPVPALSAARLVETLARAVQYAHDHRIVHRDLKPANILLQGSGPGGQGPAYREPASAPPSLTPDPWPLTPKIADFGLAKDLAGDGVSSFQTRTGEIMGTPSYMAPEQAEVKPREIGPAVDIYALGAILYELLTGRPPFKGESTLDTLEQVRTQEPVAPSRLQPRLPRDLSTICLKALAKAPNRRYANAGALADDLRRFLDGRPILARPVGASEKLWRWCRRNPMVAGMAAGIVLLVAAGIVVSTFFAIRAQQGAQKARRLLYGSDINLDQHYWEDGQISQVLTLLARHEPDEQGWEWHYLRRLCQSDLHTLGEHATPATCLAFSPDGTRLASGGGGSAIILWDTVHGRALHQPLPESDGSYCLAFSPDGGLLASRSLDGAIGIWDAASGRRLHLLQRLHKAALILMAFFQDGQVLISADAEGIVQLWDPRGGQLLRTVGGQRGALQNAAFSPDGHLLAASAGHANRLAPGKIALWDTDTGRLVRTLDGDTDEVHGLAFSPGGERLASASRDSTLRIWDMRGGQLLHVLKGHARGVQGVAFSPDGWHLASASHDNTIKLWDPSNGEQLATLRGHTYQVHALAFSPDGWRLASTGADFSVKLWDGAGRQEAHRLAGQLGATFSPDSRYLATPGSSGEVKLWDATHLQLLRILKGRGSEVWSVAFSPDGRRLAAGGVVWEEGERSGEVTIWDPDNGQVIQTLLGHADLVFSVVFSPDSTRLASGSRDGTVKIWDAARGQQQHTLRHEPRAESGGKTAVHQVAFSPDGRVLASASADFTVKLWDAGHGRELRTLEGHTGHVYGVAFSPDGRLLTSVDDRSFGKVWEVASGRLVRDLLGHSLAVTSVAFHPSQERLVTGDAVGTIKVWDSVTGQELCALRRHTKQVWGLAFSPDGRRLASASQDETVQVWDARPWTAELAVEREVVGLVEFLFARPLTKQGVLERVRTDPSISEPVRQEALAIVERAVDDPDRFDAASRAILRRPGAPASEYRNALDWAETACRLDPGRADFEIMRGVAQYRLAQYELALATLTRADELWRRHNRDSLPVAVAVLAMTQHHLGKSAEAQVNRKRLDALLSRQEWYEDPESRAYCSEAEQVIGGNAAEGHQ